MALKNGNKNLGQIQNLKDTLSEILGIQNVKIEKAHRVGDKNRSPCIELSWRN